MQPIHRLRPFFPALILLSATFLVLTSIPFHHEHEEEEDGHIDCPFCLAVSQAGATVPSPFVTLSEPVSDQTFGPVETVSNPDSTDLPPPSSRGPPGTAYC